MASRMCCGPLPRSIGRNLARRAYTLIEILVVVVILGIAAALVIPEMSGAQSLRVQAAVRSIISDITFAQSDALAMQEERAVVFEVDANRYTLVEVVGGVIDPEANAMFDSSAPGGRFVRNLNERQFGGSRLTEAAFDGDPILIFDELGSPLASPGDSTPGLGGFIIVQGTDSAFRINIDAYTGRLTVQSVEPPEPE